MHTKISIAMCSTIQMKLYRDAKLNSRQTVTNTMQQTFMFLSAYQCALIEQSAQCAAYCMA